MTVGTLLLRTVFVLDKVAGPECRNFAEIRIADVSQPIDIQCVLPMHHECHYSNTRMRGNRMQAGYSGCKINDDCARIADSGAKMDAVLHDLLPASIALLRMP